MNETDKHEQAEEESVSRKPTPKYGEPLVNGRKRFAFTIEQICDELNIPREIIDQIESSATEGIPPATFMKGYIRAYAKLVEVDADPVLNKFAQAIPAESKPLRARSNLPKETHSGDPLVKIITRLLLVAAMLAVIYGIFTYYSAKLQDYDETAPQQELFGESVDGEGVRLQIRQQAGITEDDELVLPQPTEDLLQQELDGAAEVLDDAPAISEAFEPEPEPEAEPEPVAEPEAEPEPAVVRTEDEIRLYADSDSWVEIVSADNERLFYNLLKGGSEINLSGTAPFSVFLGNAPDVTMRLNDLDVNVSGYIRANKTAQFRLSDEGGRVVFHKR